MSEPAPKAEESQPAAGPVSTALKAMTRRMECLENTISQIQRATESKSTETPKPQSPPPASDTTPDPQQPDEKVEEPKAEPKVDQSTEELKEEKPKKITCWEDYTPEEREKQKARYLPRCQRTFKGPSPAEQEKLYHRLRAQGFSAARSKEIVETDCGKKH